GPVQVRDVPEPVELGVGGRARRGMAVPEADDGDTGSEVEEAPPVVGSQPAALAVHERDVGAGIHGEDVIADAYRSHVLPPEWWRGAGAPLRWALRRRNWTRRMVTAAPPSPRSLRGRPAAR